MRFATSPSQTKHLVKGTSADPLLLGMVERRSDGQKLPNPTSGIIDRQARFVMRFADGYDMPWIRPPSTAILWPVM